LTSKGNCSHKTIDELIEMLPENFPDAADTIKNEVATRLIGLDDAVINHYCRKIKKHTNAESVRDVLRLVKEVFDTIEVFLSCHTESSVETEVEPELDPAITTMTYQIANDPKLLRKKIDIVNKMGVSGERRNISLNQITIDSRLLPLENGKPQSLGLKNAGIQGGGKSYALTTALKLYPETAYYAVSSGSAKSFYNMSDCLKHKAVIFMEGYTLEVRGSQDSEISYVVRTLMSEGFAEYSRSKKMEGEWATETVCVEGPISFLTTTIQEKLEKQLDDRVLNAQPDTSSDQTRKIIMRSAADAAGAQRLSNEMILDAWRHFHGSLVPAEVVIPYATEIAKFLPETNLPVSVRRAFNRVLSVIKTITLLYQAQRNTDRYGRLIAEYPDYAMAFQLIEETFADTLKSQQTPADERIRIIDKARMITLKALSEKVGITKPAMSQWIDSRVRNGILAWCDADGDSFEDVQALIKAKKRGTAFICIVNRRYLPTPFELTGNPMWDRGGDLYSMYDLHLDADGPVHDFDDNHVEKVKLLPHFPKADDSESDDLSQVFIDISDMEEMPKNTVTH